MMKKVLLLGLRPDEVDFSSIPGLTKEALTATLAAQEKELRELGFDAKWCLTDRGQTAESVVRDALRDKEYDVVLIGAGVRTIPEHFMLFEKLINVVHEHAAKAKLCFNTKPDDTREAVLRWATAQS